MFLPTTGGFFCFREGKTQVKKSMFAFGLQQAL